MPASVADPVACVLRTALSGKKGGPFSQDETENATELLEDRLAASAKRVLLSTIEYETAPKQQVFSMDSLKSKYTVLTSSSPSSKLASINGSSPVTTLESLPPPKVTLFRSEDVKVGWKGSVPVGAGMINLGNSCYLNSTLQALFHVPSFSNWLTSGKPCKTCENSNQLCFVCVVAKTLQSTREKHGAVIKPMPIYSRLKLICKHMVHGRQEDAHEFMRYLMEAIEKSYLQGVGGTKLDSRSKETNPLGQIFGGYIRTEVTCLKCKHTSTTFQHFQDIPLDIQHASTLEDGLGHYFRRERLEGDNAYKCDKCKSKVAATKKFSIERAPNVLCIQLKRFGLMGGKMSKHIQFSRTLNLNRFLFHQPSGSSASGSTYKFVSLINHMGPSQHCGHYTAIAEASNGNLYLFDDCSVRLISSSTALSTGAYVLIYERMQSTPGTPTNGLAKVNGIHSNPTVPPPPRAMIPRPALITEPSRPKVTIAFKKAESVQQQQKPRLVIRNGASSLFKTGVTPQTTLAGSPTKVEEPCTLNKVTNPVDPKPPALKNLTALVPYDGESSDEEEVEKPEKPEKDSVQTNPSNGTVAEGVVLKATLTKWQVSPSPTPSPLSEAGSTTSCATTAAKWQISENNQQDNSSNSTSSSSGCASHSKWNVRSLSDTETDRTNHTSKSDRKPYHSDTEIDPSIVTSKATPQFRRCGGTDANNLSLDFGSTKSEVSAELTKTVQPEQATGPPVNLQDQNPVTSAVGTVPVRQSEASSIPSEIVSGGKVVKCSNSKWDGSRGGDTVKELLRMSHSGFGDHVRTWDGGKSHLTKQVEDDKRVQRKRTADELLDEEIDKGKIKKIKTKEESRESSPLRNGYNPFQMFQDRSREQKQQHHHHHKPDHFKKDYSRNPNRNGHQGNRGGRGARGGYRGGRGDHHHHRSQPRNHNWRRFR